MPSLKRLVSVVAVALFAILGTAQTAGAQVFVDPPGNPVGGAPPSTPPGADPTGGVPQDAGPLLPPVPAPPVRHEDPKPDGGAPIWLWITLGLLAGIGASVALLLWRGSRAPAGAELPMESTAELMAVGRGR